MASTSPQQKLVRIGAHVDQADPVSEAKTRGANAAQIFLGNPQDWKKPTVKYPGGADALRAVVADADLELYVHAPYLVNVASLNNRVRIPSRKIIQQQIDLAAEVSARALIVHGGYVGADDDTAVGIDNWRKCLEQVDAKIPIYIENTAGGEGAIARKLDMIARLWDVIGASGVGFCLDTCHAFSAGLDLESVVDKITAITGRIDLVHANDSRDPLDSGADRHANVGEGTIGIEPIGEVVRSANTTAILETPGAKSGKSDDVEILRAYLSTH
jgi:deoxyribonuclease-4